MPINAACGVSFAACDYCNTINICNAINANVFCDACDLINNKLVFKPNVCVGVRVFKLLQNVVANLSQGCVDVVK